MNRDRKGILPSSGEGLRSRQKEVQKPQGTNSECLRNSRKTKVAVIECKERRERREEVGDRQAQSEQGLTRKEFGPVLSEIGSAAG